MIELEFKNLKNKINVQILIGHIILFITQMEYGKRHLHQLRPILFSMKLQKSTILLIRTVFFIVVETFPYEIV